MGFIEETGAAQYLRDSRIAAIYEGTNGIQAIDLVQRKLPLAGGATLKREIADMRAIVAAVAASGEAEFGATAARLGEAVDALEQASAYLGGALGADLASALAGATPYLRLFGLALGGVCLAKAGLAARGPAGRARPHRPRPLLRREAGDSGARPGADRSCPAPRRSPAAKPSSRRAHERIRQSRARRRGPGRHAGAAGEEERADRRDVRGADRRLRRGERDERDRRAADRGQRRRLLGRQRHRRFSRLLRWRPARR